MKLKRCWVFLKIKSKYFPNKKWILNFIEYILVQQKLCASHVLSTGIHARDTIANYTPKPLVDGVCTLSVIKVNPNTRLCQVQKDPFP